jgi:peroxiredoxin
VLSDIERIAISDWGLVHEGGMPGGEAIARPATFIVERDGTISWRSLTDNYRVRVRPEYVLDALAGDR